MQQNLNRDNVYQTYRIDRVGGGVAIYVRDMITSYVSREVKSDVNSESIWVELINGREKLIIGNIYKRPNQFRKVFKLLFHEIHAATRYRHVFIMGDFNYRNVDWIYRWRSRIGSYH